MAKEAKRACSAGEGLGKARCDAVTSAAPGPLSVRAIKLIHAHHG